MNLDKKLTGIALLEAKLTRAREDLKVQQEELERSAENARQLQANLRSLQKSVDDAHDRLALAEQRRSSYEARLASLKLALRDGWGNPGVIEGPNYTQVVALEAALADFPEARAQLSSQLEEAEAALAAFQKENDLN